MNPIDALPFEPDPEFRAFLEDYYNISPKSKPKSDKQNEYEPAGQQNTSPRPKYYGRHPKNFLTQARLTRAMTQADLAERTGTTRRTIRRIEAHQQEPSIYLALALAQALNTPVAELFCLPPLTPVPPSQH